MDRGSDVTNRSTEGTGHVRHTPSILGTAWALSTKESLTGHENNKSREVLMY